jgi:hypothetical protein
MAHSFLLTVVFFLMPISAVACGIGNDGRALIHICCHIILRSIDASFRVLLTLIGCQQCGRKCAAQRAIPALLV